jgi:tripartite-type tricarboxylate transporter receptor subunit TctC
MELFKLTAGVDLRHVPYTGSAGAVKDLAGGHVNAMFIPVHTVLPLATDNQVRLLALGSEQRSSLAPDLPTLAEQGLSGFEVDLWYALSAPAGTPKDIIATLHRAMTTTLNDPEARKALTDLGIDVVGSTPEEFRAYIKSEIPKWAALVKATGAKAE